jgi:hypothetical protein
MLFTKLINFSPQLFPLMGFQYQPFINFFYYAVYSIWYVGHNYAIYN